MKVIRPYRRKYLVNVSNPTVSDYLHSRYYRPGLAAVSRALNVMVFRIGKKEYSGSSALEIVDALQQDMMGEQHQRFSLRQFLLWSMTELSDRIPLRELDLSDKLGNEVLALNYLYLRDEYGAGEFLEAPIRIGEVQTR